MRDMRVKTHQGTSSPYGKLPGTSASDPDLEHDSAMKDDQPVKNAKSPDAHVRVIPANSNSDTKQ